MAEDCGYSYASLAKGVSCQNLCWGLFGRLAAGRMSQIWELGWPFLNEGSGFQSWGYLSFHAEEHSCLWALSAQVCFCQSSWSQACWLSSWTSSQNLSYSEEGAPNFWLFSPSEESYLDKCLWAERFHLWQSTVTLKIHWQDFPSWRGGYDWWENEKFFCRGQPLPPQTAPDRPIR